MIRIKVVHELSVKSKYNSWFRHCKLYGMTRDELYRAIQLAFGMQ
jgi:hypothetical protein